MNFLESSNRWSDGYAAVVIGASAGGTAPLSAILQALPANYSLPVIVVQHLHPQQEGPAIFYKSKCCQINLKEAAEKEALLAGWVYFAPPNYHLLVEDDRTFALSVDPKVNYSRPSIDVLFESASEVYGALLVGVVLSGANEDGANGLKAIQDRGGLAVVQDPASAEMPYMPQAALAVVQADYTLLPEQIGALLCKIGEHARKV